MKQFIANLKIAAVAIVTFTIFATATAAYAETKNFGPCNGVGTVTAITTPQYSQVQSVTQQFSSQCTNLTVGLRRWRLGQLTHNTGFATGSAQAGWVGITNISDASAFYVAAHKARVNNVLSWLAFTSWQTGDIHGAHSTYSEFCVDKQ
jgi:hypothetical protein